MPSLRENNKPSSLFGEDLKVILLEVNQSLVSSNQNSTKTNLRTVDNIGRFVVFWPLGIT